MSLKHLLVSATAWSAVVAPFGAVAQITELSPVEESAPTEAEAPVEEQSAEPVEEASAPEQPAASEDSFEIEEIVVTAQRKGESLQQVPIAISAVTGEDLQARGVNNAFQLGQTVSGLNINQTGTATTPYLRGVGSNAANPNNEASVATYVDGVYYAAPYGSVFSFNNIERIEVLKGPQGTLFGRNATGGVIQLITRKPSQTPSSELSLGTANYGTNSGNFYSTRGLSENVAADVAVQYKNQTEGWGQSLVYGDDVYEGNEFAVRSKLLFTPSDTTTMTFTGDYGQSRYSNLNYVLPKGQAGVDGEVRDQGRYDTASGAKAINDVEQYGLAADLRKDLGAAQFASITAYRNAKGLNAFDSDNTPLELITFNTPQRVETWQQELQLLSPVDSQVDWTLGLFYFNNIAAYDPARLIGMAFGPDPNSELDIFGEQHTESVSAYGQASYSFIPRLKGTAGLRFTHETQTLTQAVGAPGALDNLPQRKTDFNEPTWRLALDYEAADDIHVYASYNRGIKSGGFDLLGVGTDPFKPEFLDDYEVGFKSQFLDNRIRFNVAGFYYDYKDIQVSANPQGTIVTLNGPSATIKGLEVDSEFLVTRALRLSAGMSYLQGELGNFPNPIVYNQDGSPSSLLNAKGNDTTRTPHFTGNFAVNYSLDTAIGAIDFNSNVYHNSGFYWDVDSRLKQPEYTLVGASITWHSPDDSLSLRLWGENITNEEFLVGGVPSGTGDQLQYAAPDTFGVSMTARF